MNHAPLALALPLVVLLLLLAAASALVAARGWAGTLRRAGRVGVRTPATSASDAAFRLANKVAAPASAGSAVVGVISAGVILLGVPTLAAIAVFAVGLIGILALTAAGNGLGERAARTVPLPARAPVKAGAGCDGCACGSGGCAGLTRNVPAGGATTA